MPYYSQDTITIPFWSTRLTFTCLSHQVKKESAETEPAWQGAGADVGVQVWRIVKFKVEHWDKEEYGKYFFHGGFGMST